MMGPATLLAAARGAEGVSWLAVSLLPILYVAGDFLLARLGGWRRWAARFATRSEPLDGPTCRARVVRVGRWRHRGSLHVRLSPEGLFLRPTLGFGLFYPSLLLPWRCVHEVRERRFVGLRWLEILCRSDAPPLRFFLPWDAKRMLEIHRAQPRPQRR